MTQQQLTQQFDEKIDEALVALRPYEPEKVILFGSVARGKMTQSSDIDLIIIKKGVGGVRPHRRIAHVLGLFTRPLRVEPRVYSPEEIKDLPEDNFFLQEALAQGKVIYERA